MVSWGWCDNCACEHCNNVRQEHADDERKRAECPHPVDRQRLYTLAGPDVECHDCSRILQKPTPEYLDFLEANGNPYCRYYEKAYYEEIYQA